MTGKKRLSREESRQQTRQRLLAAAAVVIAREGYQGASVEDISAEAGFSRGAFYSNFDDKDELFLALLEQMCDAEQRQMDAIFNQGGNAEELRASLGEFYAHTSRENQQFVLYTEAQIHAIRNAEFRKRLVELERTTCDRISGFVKRYFRESGVHDDDLPHEEIAMGLMALTTGITFAQMLDPDRISNDKAITVLLSFFDAISDHGFNNR